MPIGTVKVSQEKYNQKFNKQVLWLVVEDGGHEVKGSVNVGTVDCKPGDTVEYQLNNSGWVSKAKLISRGDGTQSQSPSSSKSISAAEALEEFEKRLSFRVEAMHLTMKHLKNLGEFTNEDVRAITTSIMMDMKNININYDTPQPKTLEDDLPF